MKLYYWPKTRAFRVLWALEELEVPYEIVPVNIRLGEQHQPVYRAINPMGKIPALDDDGIVVADTAAILIYLAERFPEKGLGAAPGTPERGRFLQWMVFNGTCLEPAVTEKMLGLEPQALGRSWGDWSRVEGAMRSALEAGPWLVGGRYTVADLVLGSALDFLFSMKLIEKTPPYDEYAARVLGRPAYRRAVAVQQEQMKILGVT
jgi:glutathione S-transferase